MMIMTAKRKPIKTGHTVRKGRTRGGKKKTVAKTTSRKTGGGTRKNRAGAGEPVDWLKKNVFAKLARNGGWGGIVAVAENAGGQWDSAVGIKVAVSPDPAKRAGRSSGLRVGGTRGLEAMAAVFSSLGHMNRLRIMIKLLEGSATYRSLQKTTGTKAGPLYHHINQMRLCGLIMPKERDLYELTRGGRNRILTALAAGGLARDKRRRPMGEGTA